ncbi:MAG: hypothetical protein JJU29_22440 [Verrucomicrobia bacterium]|nr:hypothetical protein [Verrucomicrobiota bacterium]
MNTRNPSNRKLWCFVIGFLLLVILLPVILAMLPIWDGPPVDDSDMEIVYREIPDEQNAFELFREAEAVMVPIPDVWNDWEEDPQAHADEIRVWMDANREALRLLAEGVALGDYQTPEVKRLEDTIPWITDSLVMGQMLRMKTLMESDPAKRMDLHLLRLRFAELSYQAGSSLIEASVGTHLYQVALQSVIEKLQNQETDTVNLRRFLAALTELRMDEKRMVMGLKSDYRGMILHVEEIIRVGFDEYLDDWMNSPFVRPFMRPGRWGYQKENSKRLILESYHHAIAYFRGDEALDQLNAKSIEIYEFIDGNEPLHRKFHNVKGKELVSQFIKDPEFILNRYHETLADLHAARLVAALNLYHRKHGHLPDTLHALVPDLLDEVPADPFDGQPFRYLPAEARIYSIGKNREDNGGSIRVITRRRSTPDRNHTEDRVYGVFEEVELERDPGR